MHTVKGDQIAAERKLPTPRRQVAVVDQSIHDLRQALKPMLEGLLAPHQARRITPLTRLGGQDPDPLCAQINQAIVGSHDYSSRQ